MIVGIDLGTTNSLVAYFTEEGPKVIPNRLGERLTPSVVSMDENQQLYVGKTAVERNSTWERSPSQLKNYLPSFFVLLRRMLRHFLVKR